MTYGLHQLLTIILLINFIPKMNILGFKKYFIKKMKNNHKPKPKKIQRAMKMMSKCKIINS